MPITINVRDDLMKLVDKLDRAQRDQIPYAASRALNDAAQAARAAVTEQLPTIFDRPTPFTRNSIAALMSRKNNLVATVLVKDQQAKYLGIEETGGERTPAMNSRLASKALTVPGEGAKLDQYGNLPSGYQARLKRQADADIARRKAQKLARAAEASRRYRRANGIVRQNRDKGVFYMKGHGPRGRGPGGFFQRGAGHTLKRLTGFQATETYKPRFGFRGRVQAVARKTFAEAAERRLIEALKG